MSDARQVEMMTVSMRELRTMWSKSPEGCALRRTKMAALVKTGLTATQVDGEMMRLYGISVMQRDIGRAVAERDARPIGGQFRPGQSGNPGGRPKNPQPSNADVMAMMAQVLKAITEGKESKHV